MDLNKEKESELRLRAKLEMLRNDLARKKKKIEKIQRLKLAKDHVKKKIEEHNSNIASKNKDLVIQQIDEGRQSEDNRGSPSGNTPHVSFNLASGNLMNSSNMVEDSVPNKPECHTTSHISSSQEDFMDSPLGNLQRSKPHQHRQRKHTGKNPSTTLDKTVIERRIVKKKHLTVVSPRKYTLRTSQSASPQTSKTISECASKNIKEAPDSFTNVSGAKSSIQLCDVQHCLSNQPTAMDIEVVTGDTELLLNGKLNSSLIRERPASLNPETVLYESGNVKNYKCPEPLDIHETERLSEQLVDIADGMNLKRSRRKKKQRRSSTVMDFSFLDEEGSGDMYSQIKTRRRRGTSSLHTKQNESFSESQEGQSQASKGASSIEAEVDPDLLRASVYGTQYSETHGRFPKENLRFSDNVANHNLRDNQHKLTMTSSKVTKAKQFAYSESNTSSPLVNSWPLCSDHDPDQSMDVIHSTFPMDSKKRAKKISSPLIRLPPKDIFRNVNHFNLPNSEYEQLKQLKLESPDCWTHDSLPEGRGLGPSQKLMKLPPKDIFKEVSHFFLPDTEYGKLKLMQISLYNEIEKSSHLEGLKHFPKVCTHEKAMRSSISQEKCLSPSDINVRNSKKIKTTSKRKSVKLSPILKMSDNIQKFKDSTERQAANLIESPPSLELDIATIHQTPHEEKVGQKSSEKRTHNIQTNILDSVGHPKGTIEGTHSNMIDSSVTKQTSSELFIETETLTSENREAQDVLNTGHLENSLCIDISSQTHMQHPKKSNSHILQERDVTHLREKATIHSVDAVTGYLGSERAVILALASSHCVQIWSQKERQSWNFLHSQEMMNQLVTRVEVVGTGDALSLMVLMENSIEVVIFNITGTARKTTIHTSSSGSLLCCTIDMTVIVAEVNKSYSEVISYKMCEDWGNCVSKSSVGRTSDCLLSLTAVKGQQGAVMGTSTSTAYFWNHHEALLLVRMPLPINIAGTFWAITENGLVFVLVSVLGELPYLLVVNPNTGKCAVTTLISQEPERITSRLSCVSASGEGLTAVWEDGTVCVWGPVTGGLKAQDVFTEKPTSIGLVRGTPELRLLVTCAGWLRQYNIPPVSKECG